MVGLKCQAFQLNPLRCLLTGCLYLNPLTRNLKREDMRQIKIGERNYVVQDGAEVATQVLEKIFEWMQHKKHYAAHSGEGIMQDDNCTIDAPELISDIIDGILMPEC